MQWSLNGDVTWTLPRRLALAFIPALATPTLIAIAALTVFVKPRSGQEGLETPVMLFVGLLFVAIYYLHICMIKSHLKRNGR